MDKVSSLELCQVRHPIPSNQSWSLCPRKPPGRTAFSAATASFFLDPPCQFRSVQSHSFHRRPQFRRSAQFRAQNRLNPPAWWIPWWSWWIIYSCVPSKSSTTFLNVPGHFLVTKGLVILNQTSVQKSGPFWACKEILKHIQIQTWNTWNIRSTWNTIWNIQQNLASPFLSMHPKGKSCFALAPWPDETFR